MAPVEVLGYHLHISGQSCKYMIGKEFKADMCDLAEAESPHNALNPTPDWFMECDTLHVRRTHMRTLTGMNKTLSTE